MFDQFIGGGQLVKADQKGGDQPVGKANIFRQGQQHQRQGRQPECPPAVPYRIIQAECPAKQHRQRQVRHGVGILRRIAARRIVGEEERQHKPGPEHKDASRPLRARQSRSCRHTGQSQGVQRGQAGPLSPQTKGLEQERHQAGGRVGKAGFQVDGVGHIKRGALHHHFGRKAPGGELVPLGKHGPVQGKQAPDKRSTTQKQRKAGAGQGGFHRRSHTCRAQADNAHNHRSTQQQHSCRRANAQIAQHAKRVQHQRGGAEQRQRQ